MTRPEGRCSGYEPEPGMTTLAPAATFDREVVAAWLDFELQDDLRDATTGDQIGARVAATIHAVRPDDEDLRDFRYQGNLVVVKRNKRANGSVVVQTAFTGFIDRFIHEDGQTVEDDSISAKGFEIEWVFDVVGGAVKQLTMSMDLSTQPRSSSTITLQLSEVGSPRRIGGSLVSTTVLNDLDPIVLTLADGNIEETEGALATGSFGRDMAEGVIEAIGSSMVRTGRDNNWSLVAERRMLGDLAGDGTSLVRSTHDWVMFHRRRTKVCAGDVVEKPTAIRSYRWYHVDIPNLNDELRARIEEELSSPDPIRRAALLAELDFSLVSNLSFPENDVELVSSPVAFRADWSSGVDSDSLVAAVVADPPTGDGAVVALGRLNTGLDAISGLIDTTGLIPPTVINDIPVEYRTRGTDGVVFSIGSSTVEISTGVARLVRIPIEALDLVASLDGEMTLERLTEELANFNLTEENFFLAEYVEDDVANKDEVVAWWGTDPLEGPVLVGAPDSISKPALQRWLTPRAEVMSEILSGGQPVDLLGNTTWNLAVADVVMVLVGRARGGIEFDRDVLGVVLADQPDFRRSEFQVLESAMLETLSTPDELRTFASDFGVPIDRIDWTQPMNELGRDVLRVAHETAEYKDMVTEIHSRFNR